MDLPLVLLIQYGIILIYQVFHTLCRRRHAYWFKLILLVARYLNRLDLSALEVVKIKRRLLFKRATNVRRYGLDFKIS